MFTREIEEALAEGRVDLAVHSLKDLPTELAEPIRPGGHPPPGRSQRRISSPSTRQSGVFAARGPCRHQQPASARAVESASARYRGCRISRQCRYPPSQAAEGQVDAILLAAAGLDRLEKTEWVRERLDPKDFWPRSRSGFPRDRDPQGRCRNPRSHRLSGRPGQPALPSLPNGPLWPHSAAVARCPSAFTAGRRKAITATGKGSGDEIFAIVAVPETGTAIRVFHSAPRENPDPAALGLLAAKKLMDLGAGPLLQAQIQDSASDSAGVSR